MLQLRSDSRELLTQVSGALHKLRYDVQIGGTRSSGATGWENPRSAPACSSERRWHMGHDPFSAHSFDPETLRVLYTAFDAAWKSVEQHTAAADRTRVRDAIAAAVVALAQSGQCAPSVVETYAMAQALAAADLSERASYSLPVRH